MYNRYIYDIIYCKYIALGGLMCFSDSFFRNHRRTWLRNGMLSHLTSPGCVAAAA